MYKKHGFTGTSTYCIWNAMKQRCLNINSTSYKFYGEKGITICDKWLSFEGFLEDMGERPSDKSLDRIDGNKGYYKENCRWATNKEQGYNRIKSFIEFNGKIVHSPELIKKYGVNYNNFHSRISRGWTLKEALEINKRKRKISDLKNIPDIGRVGLIRWFRNKKCTYKDIGNYFNLTKQRIEQLDKRR